MHPILLQLNSKSKLKEVFAKIPLRSHTQSTTKSNTPLMKTSLETRDNSSCPGVRGHLKHLSHAVATPAAGNAVPLPSGSQDPPRYPKGHVLPNLQGALCIYFLIEYQKSNTQDEEATQTPS